MNTGCDKCDEKQELTRDQTALCDSHHLEFLRCMAEIALKEYTDKVDEILRRKEKEHDSY